MSLGFQYRWEERESGENRESEERCPVRETERNREERGEGNNKHHIIYILGFLYICPLYL